MTHAAQHQAAAAAPPASIHPEGMYRWNQFSALIPFSRETWRRAYNHAEYLDERRQLMQWWSDYLDRCAVKAENEGLGPTLIILARPSFLPLNLLALLGGTWQRAAKAAKSKTYAAFKVVLGTTLQEFGRRY